MHLADVGRFLLPWCVEQRLVLFALAHVFRISHYADDLELALVIQVRDAFAEHVFIRKELLLEGLIDDSDRGSVLIVVYRELASAQEWYAHRREIVFAYRLPHRFVVRSASF